MSGEAVTWEQSDQLNIGNSLIPPPATRNYALLPSFICLSRRFVTVGAYLSSYSSGHRSPFQPLSEPDEIPVPCFRHPRQHLQIEFLVLMDRDVAEACAS
jgi:hypothetical protein